MSVALDNKIIPADVAALFAAANSKPRLLQGQPYQLFTNNPLAPVLNYRGAWDPAATYAANDVVVVGSYQFIATAGTTNDPPLYTAADGLTSASTNWAQNWLNCYNRLRAALQLAVANGLKTSTGRALIYPWQMSVSGGLTDDGYVGWPCQSPSSLYNDQWFYFADTGGAVSVTVSAAVTNSTYTWFETSTCRNWFQTFISPGNLRDAGIVRTAFPTALLSEIIIGGSQAVTVSATFYIKALLYQGGTYTLNPMGIAGYSQTGFTSDGSHPEDLCTVDASAFFPGASFTKSVVTVGASKYVVFTCIYSGTVNPGRYGVAITGGLAGDDTYSPTPYNMTTCSRALVLQDSNTAGLQGIGTISVTNSSAVTTNGIHGTTAVKKIAVPFFNTSSGLPFGWYYVSAVTTETDAIKPTSYPTIINHWGTYFATPPWEDSSSGLGYDYIWQSNPGTQPTFDGEVIVGPTAASFSATTTGFWFGQTPPIQSGGMDGLNQYMQWNNFHVTSAGEVDSTTLIPYTGSVYYTGVTPQPAYNVADAAWERQLMPCQWKPLTRSEHV